MAHAASTSCFALALLDCTRPPPCTQINALAADFQALQAALAARADTVASEAAEAEARAAAAAAAAEAERVAVLEREAADRALEREQLAAERQAAKAAAEAASAESVALADQQAARLAEAKAAREAARLAEEEAYKEQQREAARQKEREEMQRMAEQQAARRRRAEAVLEAEARRAAETGVALSAQGLQVGQVNAVGSLAELDGAIQAASSDHIPLVVDFFAPWCGPCVRFAPLFEAAASSNRSALFVKVNCDAAAGVSAAKQVRAFPTFHVYVRGQLHTQWSGADPQRLQSALQSALAAEEDATMQDAMRLSMGDGEVGASTPPSGAASATALPEYARLADSLARRPAGGVVAKLAKALDLPQFTAAVKVLRAYVKNVTEPAKRADEKYRTINASNAAFQDRLGKHGDLATLAMTTIGFSLSSDGNWTLPLGNSVGEAAAADARPVLEAAVRNALDAAQPQPSFAPVPTAPSRLGSPSAGGGGGLQGLLANPGMMAAAQQFMGGGGLDPGMLQQLAGNPQLAAMAQQFLGGGGPGGGLDPSVLAAAQAMMGGAAPVQPPAPAPAPAPAPTPVPARAAPQVSPPAAAGSGGSGEDGDVSDSELHAAVFAGLSGPDEDAV